MMQAAQSWHRGNSGSRFGSAYSHTTVRSSLIQRQMRPVFVVIADIFVHQAPDMTYVDDDHVVEEISEAVANPTLCDAVLPRAPEAGSLGLDPEAFHCVDHFFIEVCTAIEDQICGSRIEWESLTQLLNDPGGGRMFGHIAVKDLAPVMRNHEEAVQDAEVQRWHP